MKAKLTKFAANVGEETEEDMNLKIEVEIPGEREYDLILRANGIVELDNGKHKVRAFLDIDGLRELKDALEEIFYED